MVTLHINGQTVTTSAPASSNLLWVLRDYLDLTGTKYGCGSKVCGACTVLVNGVAAKTCNLKVSSLQPTDQITTIEGLSATGTHPVQQAWVDQQVPQCGFCQSGMIMAAAALLAVTPRPTEAQIREEVTNICRCGTFNRVIAGIQRAAGPATAG